MENDFLALQQYLKTFSNLADFRLFWREKTDNVYRSKLNLWQGQINNLTQSFLSQITSNHISGVTQRRYVSV